MGSSKIISNFKNNGAVTLCDWIGKVKCKKREVKRKTRDRDLRVVAILTTALQRAETEMRKKQQERAAKWAELHLQVTILKEETDMKRQKEIDEIWTSDLNGLNNFINDLKQIKTNVVR